jgi:hypothetical protein
MKWLLMVLALIATGSLANAAPGTIQVPLVPSERIIDATHFYRRTATEIEVAILAQESAGLLTFYLDGQPVAKVSQGEAIRLYLSPGRHRFGIIRSSHVVLSSLWETDADVARNAPQFYRIFHSGGRNSGWGASFEIAPVRNAQSK